MTDHAPLDDYGALTAPATLMIQRLLPGPIERVWAYLTESDLRRQWLAAGAMALQVGAPFELVWRNDDLTDPPGQRPSGARRRPRAAAGRAGSLNSSRPASSPSPGKAAAR